MITRADDRSVEPTEIRDAGDSDIGESRARERHLAMPLAENDVTEIVS